MITVLNEMSWVSYNANKDDKRKGDCTIRALSLAYDIPYEKVSKEFRSHARGETYQYNTKPNIEWFINKYGYEGNQIFTPIEKFGVEGPVPTVGEFVDSHPTGTYLLLTGRGWMIGDNYSHIVCCIDGDVYDSWDSQSHYVKYVCVVDQDSSNAIPATRYSEDDISLYTKQVLETALQKYLLSKDGKDFHLIDYEGVNIYNPNYSSYTTVYNKFIQIPHTTHFIIRCSDLYTCNISYYINTVAAKEMPDVLGTALKPEAHIGKIVIKFSPKMNNESIDKEIETKTVSGIKKLARLLTNEEEIYSKAISGNMWDEFPLLDYKNSYANDEQMYKLLKNCSDGIKKNVIEVEWSYYNKEWDVMIKADPSITKFTKIHLFGKNAKQIKACYDQYMKDVDSNKVITAYYYYDYL